MSERVKRWPKGPWSRSRYHNPNRDIVQRTGSEDNDSRQGSRHICAVSRRDKAEQEAAARLIAAAPALVEALEDMVAMWRTVCEASGWDPEHMSQYEKAEAALSLAYGETQ